MSQNNNALLHHTLNTGSSFESFAKMSEPLSCAQAILSKIEPQTSSTYSDAIDAAITACVTQCRPAYIELPMDCVRAMVSPAALQRPLVSYQKCLAESSPRPTPRPRWTRSPPDYLELPSALSFRPALTTTLTCLQRKS